MADTSLDDFFAKKDKNKKKIRNKSTADVAIQQNSSVRKIKKKKDQEKQPATTMVGPLNSEEDQEWNDYEQETEKDYSGLRIQNLQIKSDEDDDMENELNPENDENNEGGERRENNVGPWNKTGRSTTPPPPPVPKEEELPSPTTEENPKTIGRYVPPGQRGQSTSLTPTEARMARIRNSKKEAPNIHCEVDFPSLGGAVNDIEGKDFERVRSGNRNLEDPSNHSLQLKLNNKYKALQD